MDYLIEMPKKDVLKLAFKHNRMDRFHHEMTSQEKVLSSALSRNLSHFMYVLVLLCGLDTQAERKLFFVFVIFLGYNFLTLLSHFNKIVFLGCLAKYKFSPSICNKTSISDMAKV